jgi:hypothetical protein
LITPEAQTRLSRLLDDVLTDVGESYKPRSDEKLTGLATAFGTMSRNGLMVVGRAVNGWQNSWTIDEVRNPERRAMILKDIERTDSNQAAVDNCPMAWVSKQWGNGEKDDTKRSAFWRCIRTVVHDLRIADESSTDWPSRLVWTNLYRIAPDKGGNPSQRLMNAQHASCRELLHAEIRSSDVERILFLTGLDWAYAFLPPLDNTCFSDTFGRHVHLHGELKRCSGASVRVVIASHPQGKKETQWANEVCEAFSGY